MGTRPEGESSGSDRTQRVSGRSRPALALSGLVAVAAVLRFTGLGEQSFWSDEAVTVLLVREGFVHLFERVADNESSPPLYYVLAWLWAQVAGTSETGLRSLSALAGVLAVPVAYGAGRAVVCRRAGMAAAAVVAVHPLLVWYSQEARAYALLVLLCGLSVWAFGRTRREPRPSGLAAWWLASALALSTHYFAAFVIAVETALLLRARRAPAVLVAVGATWLSALSLLPLALRQRAGGQVEYIRDTPLSERLATLAKQLLVGRDAPWDRLAALAVALVVAALVVQSLRRRGRSSRPLATAALLGVGPLGLAVLLAVAGLDYVNTQNSLGIAVPLAVAFGGCVARGASGRSVHAFGVICVVWVALVVGAWTDDRYRRANWREAFGAAVESPATGRRLLVVGPDYEGWFARAPARVYLPGARSVDSEERTVPRFRALVRRSADTSHLAEASPVTEEIVFVLLGPRIDRDEALRFVARRERTLETVRRDGYELLRVTFVRAGPPWTPAGAPAQLSGVPVAILSLR